MVDAFLSKNSSNFFSPPSALVAALLDFRPSTLSVVLLAASLAALGALGTCDVSPPSCRARFCWSLVFALGPAGRVVPRRVEEGFLLIPAPDLLPEAGSITRSPSRSTRGAGPRPRLEMPPRAGGRDAPVEDRVCRVEEVPARGPVGGGIVEVVDGSTKGSAQNVCEWIA